MPNAEDVKLTREQIEGLRRVFKSDGDFFQGEHAVAVCDMALASLSALPEDVAGLVAKLRDHTFATIPPARIDLREEAATALQSTASALAEARAQVEVGHQISGSFFAALKPLKLPAINVADPGQHVTELITALAEMTRTAEESRIDASEWQSTAEQMTRQRDKARDDLRVTTRNYESAIEQWKARATAAEEALKEAREADEGYPGIAHDFEAMKSELSARTGEAEIIERCARVCRERAFSHKKGWALTKSKDYLLEANEADNCANEIRALSPSGTAGEWVMVPREPSAEMLKAGDKADSDYSNNRFADPSASRVQTVYNAMLAALPSPPTDAGKTDGQIG